MGCISINQISDKWYTYVTSLNLGNLFADILLLVSSFLRKEYGINAIILNKIEMKEERNNDIIISNTIIYIGILIGYIIFLGGLINEKIKERKTKIKHLLYLSGSNSWSYWIAFFIIDYLKLLVFSFCLLNPFYIILKDIGDIFFNLLIINASSLIFIYFISFFCSNAKSGIKFLLLLLITFVILILVTFIYRIILYKKITVLYNLCFETPILKFFFYFSPISSFLFSVSYMMYLFDTYKFDELKKYLNESKIIQGINFIFYFLLFILMETGYLKRFYNWIKLKLFLRGNNFVFSEDQLPNEFLLDNNKKNQLLFKKDNNQSNKYEDLNKNNNKISLNNNSNSNIINPLLFENNNQVKIKYEEPDAQKNNILQDYKIKNNNLNQPLMQDEDSELIINNLNGDNINHSIYKVSSREGNQTYGIKKSNPNVNEEKYKLDIRNDFTTRIEGLYKTFWLCCKKNVRAINNLNLGLEANEKFGLLGFNGSGKTTTFKAITNEILYDYGKISLFGFDTRKQFKYIRSKIGYCPQENPLFDFMKVREILEFYSKLKTCFFSVEELCKNFGLIKYLDTYCINLSGGNKRKLTFAIAIMNRPTLLLLDEPSTGVDPDSRRFMWKNINELSNSGHRYNMILTTHSMEEAEILCDRVGWLKHGSFVCIGNPEKLKIKYSQGYKLHIKFDEQVINQNKDSNNISESFQIISGLIDGFSNYSNFIMNNQGLESHINALIIVVNKIKSNTKNISLVQVRKDLSFELILNIIQERKYILFSDVLNLKNTDNNISEINISLDSLDNILTSFI